MTGFFRDFLTATPAYVNTLNDESSIFDGTVHEKSLRHVRLVWVQVDEAYAQPRYLLYGKPQWNNPGMIIGDRLRAMREEKKLS